MITFKRGDTFLVSASLTDELDEPIPMTGWALPRAHVRNSTDALISELVAAWVNQALGTYSLSLANTNSWPIEKLYCDVEYVTDSSQVISTETFEIKVVKDITLPVV